MRLLVIRHAIAETREEFASSGKDDSFRPLTSEGRAKMARAARGLRHCVPDIDVLASSPFVRAMQTAEIVAREFEGLPIATVPVLAPDEPPDAFLGWLRGVSASHVAVVGHEPDLGALVTWLIAGVDRPAVPLKKGGACLLEFDDAPAKGAATLVWLLTPSLLRGLAD